MGCKHYNYFELLKAISILHDLTQLTVLSILLRLECFSSCLFPPPVSYPLPHPPLENLPQGPASYIYGTQDSG